MRWTLWAIPSSSVTSRSPCTAPCSPTGRHAGRGRRRPGPRPRPTIDKPLGEAGRNRTVARRARRRADRGQPDAGRGDRPRRRGTRTRRPAGVGRGPPQRDPLSWCRTGTTRPGADRPVTSAVDVVSDQAAIAQRADALRRRAARTSCCRSRRAGCRRTRVDGRTRVANLYSLRRGIDTRALYQHTALRDRPTRSYLNELAEQRRADPVRAVGARPQPGRRPRGGAAADPDRRAGPARPGRRPRAERHRLGHRDVRAAVGRGRCRWRRSSTTQPRRDRTRPDPRRDPAADGRGREGRGDLAAAVDLGAHLPAAHRRLHGPGRRHQPLPGRRHRRPRRAHRQPRRPAEPTPTPGPVRRTGRHSYGSIGGRSSPSLLALTNLRDARGARRRRAGPPSPRTADDPPTRPWTRRSARRATPGRVRRQVISVEILNPIELAGAPQPDVRHRRIVRAAT